MGRVYEGVNFETQEPAAVKILSASLSMDPDFRQRFEGEIETLKKLRHPNIVRLFGFGEQDGVLFFAMELVAGLSLEEELERGRRFHWREVARIGIQTCRALRHAHDRGIIHRDLKPANLLLASDNEVKLSDFGIARLFGDAQMTAVGNVLGTVEYMAPEQADAKPVGPRTDLYSLGGVMYALLVGRPPFRGRSLAEILHKQRSVRPEPVTRFNSSVPGELDHIVQQLLEKAPEARIANATVLSRRLEAMLHALPEEPQTAEEEQETHRQGDFQVTRPAVMPELASQGDLPHTRELTEPGEHPAAPLAGSGGEEELGATKLTSAFAKFAKESQMTADVGVQKPDTHGGSFVAVAEEDLDRVEERERRPLVSVQTWILVAALAVIGVTAWHFLQPPTADDLYQRITEMTAEGSLSSYRLAEADIKEFLSSHSDDSRCVVLREYLAEIQLDREKRRYERELASTANLLPVQAAYLEAIRYAEIDPEVCVRKLRALDRLFVKEQDESGPTGQILKLARGRLEQLESQVQRNATGQLSWINGRLNKADEICADNPEGADGIRKSIIELYGSKPWAAEAVERAQKALGECPK
jgi:serine/threonine-protein kinase